MIRSPGFTFSGVVCSFSLAPSASASRRARDDLLQHRRLPTSKRVKAGKQKSAGASGPWGPRMEWQVVSDIQAGDCRDRSH